MKKNWVSLLCAFIFIFLVFPSRTAYANQDREFNGSTSACDAIACIDPDLEVESEYMTEAGHLIKKYNNGVEVEIVDTNSFIVRDYMGTINASPAGQARSWVSVGYAIVTFVIGVVNSCSAVQYVTGHDICRIVLSYITAPAGTVTYTYNVTGLYVAGYIPGCEPSHSLPCNSGYWEYTVTRS